LPQLHLKMAVDLLLAAKDCFYAGIRIGHMDYRDCSTFFCQERLVKQERK